jgi:hypothetical protein
VNFAAGTLLAHVGITKDHEFAKDFLMITPKVEDFTIDIAEREARHSSGATLIFSSQSVDLISVRNGYLFKGSSSELERVGQQAASAAGMKADPDDKDEAAFAGNDS